MLENLITEYGILRPLSGEEIVELNRSMADFEDVSGLCLAPYLLVTEFLDHLKNVAETLSDSEKDGDEWLTLWAVVHDADTVVGFLDFSKSLEEPGYFSLRWTFNPDWVGHPLSSECIRALSDKAFEEGACRHIRVHESMNPDSKMAHMLRCLGFRKVEKGERTGFFRLSKPVEGRLL